MTTHDNIPTVLDNSIVEISLCELVQCDGTLTYITKIESDTCTPYTCTTRYTQRASPLSSPGTVWSTRVLPVSGYKWSIYPMTRAMEHRWGRCGWTSSAWVRWRAEPNVVKAQGPTPLLWSVLCTCRWCPELMDVLWWAFSCDGNICVYSLLWVLCHQGHHLSGGILLAPPSSCICCSFSTFSFSSSPCVNEKHTMYYLMMLYLSSSLSSLCSTLFDASSIMFSK